MVEEVLVKGELSSEEINVGENLLRRLDMAKADVIAAYWIFNPEVGTWRLEFVSPQVESKGPLKFYSLVYELLDAEPKLRSRLGFGFISVLGPKYSFYKSLISAIKCKKELMNTQLNRCIVDGQLVDLYIYRLSPNRGS
ncbi:MAG TPA: hypothetical protein VGB73_19150 [Pyrinomonadaceae bacterium]|jgi:hypothetical protein